MNEEGATIAPSFFGAPGNLLFYTPFNLIVALDSATGRERWVSRSAGRAARGMAVADAAVPG